MKNALKVLALVALFSNITSSFAVDLTLSPVYTAVDLVRSALVTVAAPFAVTSASSIVAAEAKMEVEAISDEAMNHLAGEAPTERLLATIDYLRENIEELEDKSIEEIELTIIEAAE